MTRKLTQLLCSGLALFMAAPVLAQNPNRIPGEPYLNGINIAWRSFSADYGSGRYDATWWANTFADMKAYKVNAARVWVHPDGAYAFTWNASRQVTGLAPNFTNDLRDMLDKAHANGIRVQLCLWSFDMVKDYTASRGAYAGLHAPLITNATNRSAYLNNALIPMIDAIKDRPGLLSIEICNEPEWMITENPSHNKAPAQNVSLAQARAFFKDIRDTVKSRAPNLNVTLGSASVKWSDSNAASHPADSNVGEWWAGLGLDYRSVHYYSWMVGTGYNHDPFANGRTPAYYGLEGKPTIIGEFGGKGNYPYNNGLTQMQRAYSNGYSGHMSWMYSDDRHADDIAQNGLWQDFRNFHLTFANTHNLGGGGGGTTDTQAPSAPTNLTSPSKTDTSVSLSWTASTDNFGVTGYDIYRGATLAGTSSSTSFNATGLTASTTYSFTVRAKDAAGNVSAASSALSVTTNAAPGGGGGGGGDVKAEAEAGILTGCSVATSLAGFSGTGYVDAATYNAAPDNIRVSVTVATAGNYTLRIRYAATMGDKTQTLLVNDVDRGGVSFLSTSTWANRDVLNVPFNAGANTIDLRAGWGYMHVDSFEVLGAGGGGTTDTQAPSAPTNLASPSKTSNSVSLSWTASTDNVGVTGYDIYHGSTLAGSSTTTSFTVTGLAASTAYSFTVRAKDAAGNVSTASSALSVTTNAASDTQAPTAPTSLTSPSKTSNSVSLSWTASTDNVGVTGYDIYNGAALAGSSTTTSFTVTGLAASTQYTFTVRAKDAAGNVSAASSGLMVTTNAATGGGDTAQFNFESSTHGFVGTTGVSLSSSLDQAFAGTRSLRMAINVGASGGHYAKLSNPSGLSAGTVITFRIWVPANVTTLSGVQPYIMDNNWTWTGNWQTYANLTKGAWNTLTVTVPANASAPIRELGVHVQSTGALNTSVYVDSISW